MLDLQQVISALDGKKEALVGHYHDARSGLTEAQPLVAWLSQLDAAAVMNRLAGKAHPGAIPTRERTAGNNVIRTFPNRWQNRTEATAWARHVLERVQTCAVDGSQIAPSRDFSIPIGAVQVGCYINDHCQAGSYSKTVAFEVLGANELAQDEGDLNGFPDQQINLRRFQLECLTLCDYMQRSAERGTSRLAFFDGSFILSFVGLLQPDLSQAYVSSICSVLEASQECRVPVVGYVDTSYARDLIRLLQVLSGQEMPASLTDAGLLEPEMRWGDRTEAWQCARQDRLSLQVHTPSDDYYSRVHFMYIKATSQNPPARLEMPSWIAEEGLAESVVDIVRAECIIGSGYPYPVETADALAVLDMQDRERFYRVFQDYLGNLNIPLRYARKASSKRQRR